MNIVAQLATATYSGYNSTLDCSSVVLAGLQIYYDYR